jgi:hypothetical protein
MANPPERPGYTTLRLHVEGRDGEIGFESFVAAMNRCLSIIRDVDRVLSARSSPALHWVVIDLGTASLDAVIRARQPQPRFYDLPPRVAEGSVEALRIADSGDALPPYLSETGLNVLEMLANGLRRNGATGLSLTHVEAESAAHVGPETRDNLKRLRVPAVQAIGSITGTLEAINVHATPRFSVYDVVTRRPVSCKFATDDLEEVKAALGSRVNVAGIVHRNSSGQPLRVDKAKLTILPRAEELPTAADFVGHDPHFTGQLSTDDYMRKLRDG